MSLSEVVLRTSKLTRKRGLPKKTLKKQLSHIQWRSNLDVELEPFFLFQTLIVDQLITFDAQPSRYILYT